MKSIKATTSKACHCLMIRTTLTLLQTIIRFSKVPIFSIGLITDFPAGGSGRNLRLEHTRQRTMLPSQPDNCMIRFFKWQVSSTLLQHGAQTLVRPNHAGLCQDYPSQRPSSLMDQNQTHSFASYAEYHPLHFLLPE